MRKSSIALVLSLAALAASAQAQDRATILAVFAHPDDETTVAPALAKYAAEGHDVYLATITSGQAGNANTDIPKGPKLGEAREAESRCSAAALGIHEPFLLGFQDGATTPADTQNAIAARLTEIFEQVRPDIVITWGPDGLTGHPDHR
ncbi:MAG: PIG-L family deacetylase, partial [Acidobacteria bacterium]|nr:PIG-L family deacetylase [Acidobacteriota bacterium]